MGKNKEDTIYDMGDYSLSLLSEANGMTLLVTKEGQVFWVNKSLTGSGVKLIPLNKGVNIMQPIKHITPN